MSLPANHVPAYAPERWPGEFHWRVRPRAYAKDKNPVSLPLGDMEISGLSASCPCGCGREACVSFFNGARELWNGDSRRPTLRTFVNARGCSTRWNLLVGKWYRIGDQPAR